MAASLNGLLVNLIFKGQVNGKADVLKNNQFCYRCFQLSKCVLSHSYCKTREEQFGHSVQYNRPYLVYFQVVSSGYNLVSNGQTSSDISTAVKQLWFHFTLVFYLKTATEFPRLFLDNLPEQSVC